MRIPEHNTYFSAMNILCKHIFIPSNAPLSYSERSPDPVGRFFRKGVEGDDIDRDG